ncbi:MAG: hydroxyacid dehydrogenase [Candidatus Hadarchaeota archaeon]|nr:hydroxyacid dehydrogenase [Candidatus Hadarchaeota archaeon]
MTRVLITDPIHDDGIKALREFAEVGVKTNLKSEELADCIANYDVLIVRSATKVTREVIEAGDKLKLIVRAGVGLDNIDLKAAEARDVKVLNTPEAPTVSVAELVLGLMLTWARRISQADASMKRGKWEKSKLAGTELRGKTLGIIGTGRVGRAVAYRARAFEMKLLAYDVELNSEFAKKAGVQYVDLKTLLRESDYVTLHVPLMPQTEHMIGEREFELMKPTAVLVNTARGEIIDEAALVRVLKEKKIAGACLDVYEQEPPEGSPLLRLSNTVLTPHLGASSKEAQREAAVLAAKKIREELVQ